MNKYVCLMLVFMLIGIVNASTSSLGIFKTGESIELKQTCTFNGTFCDNCYITSVSYPNSARIINDVTMTKRTSDFNYTLSGIYTKTVGTYRVEGYCLSGDVIKNWVYYFDISSSGFGIINNIMFYLIIIVLSCFIMVLGFYLKDGWIVIFGTFGLYFVGLYMLINGIVGIRDMSYTYGLSIIILGIAGYISIQSAKEMLE